MNRRIAALGPAVLAGCLACTAPQSPPAGESATQTDEDYRASIEEWRAGRAERLESESGWLALVGLHWLAAGENRFGADPANDVVLPEGEAPAHAGSLVLEGDQVRLRAAPEAGITLDGEPVRELALRPDTTGEPDVLELGDLRFYVIRRADRFGIRVKNPNSPVRLGFTGLDYFDLDPAYRVDAKWVPHEEPREIPISTVIGTEEPMLSLGYAEFELDGQTVTLEPVVSDPSDDSLWFIFRDGTSGHETYGAGRYLYSEREADGRVTIDFNKAYNPPCVFTPYATCPLPPPQNRVAARIEAGEKMYGEQH